MIYAFYSKSKLVDKANNHFKYDNGFDTNVTDRLINMVNPFPKVTPGGGSGYNGVFVASTLARE